MRRFVPLAAVLGLAACNQPTGGEVDEGGGSKPIETSSDGPADSPAPGRPVAASADQPCTLQNTMGVWGLVHIEAAEPGVQDFYRNAPYEYLRIRPGGAYAYFATNAAVPDVGQINGSLDRADAADGVSDVADFREPGLMVVLRDGRPFQAFRCIIAGSAQGEAQAGDMVWTQYEGMPRLYRVQRRLQ